MRNRSSAAATTSDSARDPGCPICPLLSTPVQKFANVFRNRLLTRAALGLGLHRDGVLPQLCPAAPQCVETADAVADLRCSLSIRSRITVFHNGVMIHDDYELNLHASRPAEQFAGLLKRLALGFFR